ncbi:MAG: hypothetical protein EHM24_31565, partial [Acidobacteria bacterium]
MRWLKPRRSGLLGGLLWLVAILAAHSGSPATPAAPNGTPPEVTLESVHMLETRNGARLWEVRADRADVYEREGYTVLSRQGRPVEVVLFSAQGQLTGQWDAVQFPEMLQAADFDSDGTDELLVLAIRTSAPNAKYTATLLKGTQLEQQLWQRPNDKEV